MFWCGGNPLQIHFCLTPRNWRHLKTNGSPNHLEMIYFYCYKKCWILLGIHGDKEIYIYTPIQPFCSYTLKPRSCSASWCYIIHLGMFILNQHDLMMQLPDTKCSWSSLSNLSQYPSWQPIFHLSNWLRSASATCSVTHQKGFRVVTKGSGSS